MANAAFISVYCGQQLAMFEAAAHVAKLSRSEIFRVALEEYIDRHGLRPKITRYLLAQRKSAKKV